MRSRAPLFGLLAALVLTAIFWFGLYRPAAARQEAFELETATLQGEAASLQARIARLEEVRSDEVAIRASLARLEEFIPTNLAQPSAIRQFQASADAAGVEIESVAFEVPEVVQGAPPTGTAGTVLGAIPVTAVLRGGYFQMVDFFRRLEVEVPRAVLVQSVAVAEDDEAGFPTLTTSWTGRLFAEIPAPAPDPAAAPAPTAEGVVSG